MPKSLPASSATQRCCFVLWGDQCDEAAAALFVTMLRAAGLRVWVVGMSGKRISGAHGLQLVADLALNQALLRADQAICVIAPCPAETLAHFLHDPRLRSLLEATVHQAIPCLLAQSTQELHKADPLLALNLSVDQLTFYPRGEPLLPFIRALVATLTAGQA